MLLSLKSFTDLSFAFPDILSALSLIILILIKSFMIETKAKIMIPKLSVVLSFISLMGTIVYSVFDKQFNTGLFVYNYNLAQMKIILLSLACFWFIFLNYTRLYKGLSSIFFILTYGIINAITLCLSANNFLILILALELYTFSLGFFLITQDSKNRKCAVRFFLTSSIMSAVFIFGCSLLYSQFGSLSFSKIKLTSDFASITGCILIICALLFKIGCPPFHSWMLDVYEKASSIVILFLESIWKIFMFFIFARVVTIFLQGEYDPFRLILLVISVSAMVLGTIMPLFQRNIHKFIAAASMGHIGFMLTVVVALTYSRSLSVVMSYLSYYSLAIFCFFTGILIIKNSRPVKEFSDLSGLFNASPLIGFLILLSMFAMIGVPPFGNFIAKLDIFKFFIRHDAYFLLIVSMFYSVVSIVYVIKWSRFFFKPVKNEPIANQKSVFIPLILLMALPISVVLYEMINNYFAQILKSIV